MAGLDEPNESRGVVDTAAARLHLLQMAQITKVGEPAGMYMVGASGLEPPTPTMSRWCSNQLSYAPEVCRSIQSLYRIM